MGDAVEGEDLAVVVVLTLLLALEGALHRPVGRNNPAPPKNLNNRRGLQFELL